MFNPEEVLKLKQFCQSIISRPRMMEEQAHQRSGTHLWCHDWELIEICKYLFHGRELYMGDPPPNRLKDNPLFNQQEIVLRAESLLNTLNNADDIIAFLQKEREDGRRT